MRMMMKISLPVETGNKALKDGSLAKIMKSFMDEAKPESAYFTTMCGKRTAIYFLDMKDQSQMPSMAEPFYMGLNADVQFTPVMNATDLQKGLEIWMKKG